MRKKKDKKKINTIMAVFIAVIMVGSIVGMMFSGDSEDKLEYNGHKFKIIGNQLAVEVNNQEYYFYYHPVDLEVMNVSEEVQIKLNGMQMFYFTFDPDTKDIEYLDKARFDLNNEAAKTNLFFVNAISKESEIYNFPIITCDNATAFVPVVYVKEGNKTGFYLEEDCIIAESKTKEGFLALKDRLMYEILGIM